MLNRFVKPSPSTLILKLTHPLNDVGFLFGFPLFNKIPLIRKIPFIGKGVCNIQQICYHSQASLRISEMKSNINFVGPNHPEFFTDWMLDKHIVGKEHLYMVSWAANSIVNGMGKSIQKFWLANNLIAQIPSTGNPEGKAYAIEQALHGHPVLMHPEGQVHWTSQTISPIFDGIAELAIRAYHENTDKQRKVLIHNPVWQLSFVNTPAYSLIYKLHKELDYLAASVNCSPIATEDLGLKLNYVQNAVVKYHVHLLLNKYIGATIKQSYTATQQDMLQLLAKSFINENNLQSIPYQEHTLSNQEWQAYFKTLNKQAHPQEHDKKLKTLNKKIMNLVQQILKWNAEYYTAEILSAEQVAECIQRLRTSFCHRNIKDKIHQYVPTPIAPRRCDVYWDSPIDVSALIESNPTLTVKDLTALVQANMERALANLNKLTQSYRQTHIPNPWFSQKT